MAEVEECLLLLFGIRVQNEACRLQSDVLASGCSISICVKMMLFCGNILYEIVTLFDFHIFYCDK